MNRLAILLVTSVFLFSSVGAELVPDKFPPVISLHEALDIAENYVKEKKIDVTNYHQSRIILEADRAGKYKWVVQWMSNTRTVKGDWFIVKVSMDKTVFYVPGK